MSELKIFIWCLKLLRILGFLPYKWKFFRVYFASNEKLNQSMYFYSRSSCNGNDKKHPLRFYKSTCWLLFSSFQFFTIAGFGICVFYDHLWLENQSTMTYKIAVPIFGGAMLFCIISSMIHINSKSLKLTKIFNRILKNITALNTPNKLSSQFFNWNFIIFLVVYIKSMIVFLIAITFSAKKSHIFHCIEFGYYFLVYLYFLTISLLFKLICCFCSTDIEKYLLLMKSKTIVKEIPDNPTVETKLKILVSKFSKLNKHQKLLNSYFGPLITYVIVIHILWLVFIPFLFALSVRNCSFEILLSVFSTVLWPSLGIYGFFTAPSIFVKKVR